MEGIARSFAGVPCQRTYKGTRGDGLKDQTIRNIYKSTYLILSVLSAIFWARVSLFVDYNSNGLVFHVFLMCMTALLIVGFMFLAFTKGEEIIDNLKFHKSIGVT